MSKLLVTIVCTKDIMVEHTLSGHYDEYGRLVLDNFVEGMLGIDHRCYFEKDPKRLMDFKRNVWTNWRVKTILMDSKALRKESAKTR